LSIKESVAHLSLISERNAALSTGRIKVDHI
jgi:hypothetical protein